RWSSSFRPPRVRSDRRANRRTPRFPIPAGTARRATRSERANDPESDAALPAGIVGGDEIAVGGPADRRIVRPRAAPQDPLAVGRARQIGAAVRRGVRVI